MNVPISNIPVRINNIDDIKEAMKNITSAITMKGALYSYAIIKGYKLIENRSKYIKPGWIALHTGNSKLDKDSIEYIKNNLKDIDQIPEEESLTHGAIIGLIHISSCLEYNTHQELLKNKKWAIGPYCGIIDKVIEFHNVINCRGFITMLWKLTSVDNDLKKKDKYHTSLKNKILKELDLLLINN